MAMPFGQAESREQNDLSTHTFLSMAAGMLLVLSVSGASYSNFGHKGGSD